MEALLHLIVHTLLLLGQVNTLQELKLQGKKIRIGFILSQYSRIKWFATTFVILRQ